MNPALPWLKKNFVTMAWGIIAFTAVIGLAGCGAKGFGTPLSSSDAVAPYVDAGNESPGTFALLDPERYVIGRPRFVVASPGKAFDRTPETALLAVGPINFGQARGFDC